VRIGRRSLGIAQQSVAFGLGLGLATMGFAAFGPDHRSGLGLAIVRRLAAADGGQAELREAPGGEVDAVVRLRPG
jgi:hypothetical protein